MDKSRKLLIGAAIAVPLAVGGVLAAQEIAKSGRTSVHPAQSPLAAYPGFGHNAGEDRRAFAAEEARRQQIIAQCMRDAGFQYVSELSQSVSASDAARMRRRSQAAPESPNERYRAGLTVEKRTEYNMALYGVPDPNDPNNLWNPSSPTGGGCWGQAIRAFDGIYAASNALRNEYWDMRQAIGKDRRVVEATAKWSSCMSGKGFNLASLQELASAQANMGMIRDKPTLSPDQVEAATAASGECLGSAGYEAAVRTATIEAETAFVERHKSVLEAKRPK
ncbi:MAG TPA: hypothetical protein VFZ91_01300 [Allosphingosinicella sp.]